MNNLNSYINRINLNVSFDELMEYICANFQIGRMKSFKIIQEGYEDLNIKVKTNLDSYLVKIFSKQKNVNQIVDNIAGLVNFFKAQIPVPKLYRDLNGNFLHMTTSAIGKNRVCVMKFIDGENFENIIASDFELKTFANYLSKIHSLDFQVKKTYDSWSPSNLIQEFAVKRKFLTQNQYDFVIDIINEFKLIDFSRLNKTLIHGTPEKKHFLKCKKHYTIIDLGCLNIDFKVTDLAIFITQFAVDYQLDSQTIAYRIKLVLKEYQKKSQLTEYEKNILPLFIKATYISYFITTCMLNKINKTAETQEWNIWAMKGLKLSEDYLKQYISV